MTTEDEKEISSLKKSKISNSIIDDQLISIRNVINDEHSFNYLPEQCQAEVKQSYTDLTMMKVRSAKALINQFNVGNNSTAHQIQYAFPVASNNMIRNSFSYPAGEASFSSPMYFNHEVNGNDHFRWSSPEPESFVFDEEDPTFGSMGSNNNNDSEN